MTNTTEVAKAAERLQKIATAYDETVGEYYLSSTKESPVRDREAIIDAYLTQSPTYEEQTATIRRLEDELAKIREPATSAITALRRADTNLLHVQGCEISDYTSSIVHKARCEIIDAIRLIAAFEITPTHEARP